MMLTFPRILRLTRSGGGLIVPSRARSHPRVPLTDPIPGLAASLGPQSAAPPPTHPTETRITTLENGLRVASQETFGQYSNIGGL